jgi:hypothetical protein
MKRPPGTELSKQDEPMKLAPEALTAVPTGPDVVPNVKVGVRRLNRAVAASRLLPVTMTVYGVVAPDATVNEPDIVPPATVHIGFVIKPLGFEVIAQLVSKAEKPEPNTVTPVPGAPEAGFRVIAGVTVKLVNTRSPVSKPVTTRGFTPRVEVELIWNTPFRFPPEIAQVQTTLPPPQVPTVGAPVMEHAVSLRLKPVPVTFTQVPGGP